MLVVLHDRDLAISCNLTLLVGLYVLNWYLSCSYSHDFRHLCLPLFVTFQSARNETELVSCSRCMQSYPYTPRNQWRRARSSYFHLEEHVTELNTSHLKICNYAIWETMNLADIAHAIFFSVGGH